MGSGWHEWPLMIFTVFGQCVQWWFYRSWLWRCSKATYEQKPSSVHTCMFGLWVLMGIGFIASMLHLGSPMRALACSTG